VSYQNGCYRKKENLRVKQITETNTCLVFTPDNPNLYSLNTTALLIFNICDGKSREEVERIFLELVELNLTSEEAKKYFNEGFNSLLSQEIIECVT
jgi:hypothetical protein